MIRRIATLMLVVSSITSVSVIGAEEIDAEAAKLAAIKELLASTGAPANSQQFTRAFSQQLVSVLKIANPKLSEEAINIVNEEVDKIVSQAFANDALQKEIYPLYAKYFTLQELEALVVFNRSAVGKKANAIMPQLMQESLEVAELWSQQIGPLISTEVLRRFAEEGISIRMSPERSTE